MAKLHSFPPDTTGHWDKKHTPPTVKRGQPARRPPRDGGIVHPRASKFHLSSELAGRPRDLTLAPRTPDGRTTARPRPPPQRRASRTTFPMILPIPPGGRDGEARRERASGVGPERACAGGLAGVIVLDGGEQLRAVIYRAERAGGVSVNSYVFPRIKEEEDMESSYTDNSGQELSSYSDVFEHIKTEDSSNSYGSVREEGDRMRGNLIYNPDTLLWIKRVDEAEMTTDDDSEAKEPQHGVLSIKEGYLKTGSTSSITDKEVRRRPRFSASEEFVLVTEMLEHYDRLFGGKARITPFPQKVLIWQKVLNNVNAVGVVQRGIEEAKKHWHLYRHRLMEKLASVRKHGSAPGHPLFLQLTPMESKVANLFKLEYMLRSPQHGLQSQNSMDVAGEKGSACVQNGSGSGDPGVGSLGQGDCPYTKAPRNIKFSFDENCALVHEAVGVWDSIIGKNAATISQARKNFLWSRIVEAVNAAGTQPRSAENCKKRLRDIKRRVKAKMVDQRKYYQRNSGGPVLELQYLSYEEELMHVIGPDTVRPIDGHVDTDREPRLLNHHHPALIGFPSPAPIGQKKEGLS
ncbi:PREDICTED: uncharacterized protein LOC108793202 [Nanorana parkeri]|uniref:uncharacterized protein LOC108793202 n=1 Tax=Nanorana parkeri TaxID=125878 RepID=UPI00085426A1|nr:PREDICTED: uncharacterized protein LOC108793202 [Nanorana parkeri]